jgi:hypothetical protein
MHGKISVLSNSTTSFPPIRAPILAAWIAVFRTPARVTLLYCCKVYGALVNTHGVRAQQESHLGNLFDFAHKLGCSSHRLYLHGIYIVDVNEMHYVDLCRYGCWSLKW